MDDLHQHAITKVQELLFAHAASRALAGRRVFDAPPADPQTEAHVVLSVGRAHGVPRAPGAMLAQRDVRLDVRAPSAHLRHLLLLATQDALNGHAGPGPCTNIVLTDTGKMEDGEWFTRRDLYGCYVQQPKPAPAPDIPDTDLE